METSGVHFGSLKTYIFSAKLENVQIGTYSQHIGYSELENIRRINIFVHDKLPRNSADVTKGGRIVKRTSSIFKPKRSTELKTGQQINVLRSCVTTRACARFCSVLIDIQIHPPS